MAFHQIADAIDTPSSGEFPPVELPPLTEERLVRRIFVLRGSKVMLDATENMALG